MNYENMPIPEVLHVADKCPSFSHTVLNRNSFFSHFNTIYYNLYIFNFDYTGTLVYSFEKHPPFWPKVKTQLGANMFNHALS